MKFESTQSFEWRFYHLGELAQKLTLDMCKFMVVEHASSRIKNYSQIFEIHLNIIKNKSRLNPQGGRLKDSREGLFNNFQL